MAKRRVWAALASAIFLVVAPGTVAGLVPFWISGWRAATPAGGVGPMPFTGGMLLGLGAVLLLDSFVRFAREGLGTPAPVFPTQHLVVTGPYRHVRNPMYLGVISLILGQGLLLGDLGVVEYGAVVWVGFHLFVLAYEEPTLARRYGAGYERFRANVRRWLPRLTPWRSEG